MNGDELRLSDAEREQAAADLGEHFAQGRLTADEHTERLDRIWAARTRGELGPLFADLPGPGGPAAPPPSGPAAMAGAGWSGGFGPWGRRPWRRGIPAPFFAVLAVLIVLTIVTHLPLVLIGLLVWFLVFGRHRRRAWGHQRSVR